jgi:hypothetical protein
MMSDSDSIDPDRVVIDMAMRPFENALLAHFPSLHRPVGFTQVSA